MQDQKPNAHQLAADNILTVMIHNGEAFRTAMFELGLNSGHMPTTKHQALLLAVIAARGATPDGSLHDITLLDMVGGRVDASWLIDIHVGYDRLMEAAFERDLAIVIRHGRALSVQRDLHAQAAQITPDNFDAVIGETLSTLAAAGQVTRIQNEYASDNGADFSTLMEGDPEPGLCTGLTWLDDDMMCRISHGRVMYVAGGYKTGKTRLAMNIALGNLMLEPDARGAIYSREVQRNDVIAQFVSMLAVSWLVARNLENTLTAKGIPLTSISADKLTKARRLYKTWDRLQVEAIDYGIQKYRQFENRLAIYDSGRQSGGLHDVNSLERMFKRNLSLQNADWHFIDYAQLFAVPGSSEVERSDARAVKFQELAITNDKMVIVLAQRNEEALKANNNYSAGIRGGGQYSAAADYVLLTNYKVEHPDDKDTFPVEVKFSKWGETGKTDMTIHPASGLILESSWIK
jgi:replicative DNA helicase